MANPAILASSLQSLRNRVAVRLSLSTQVLAIRSLRFHNTALQPPERATATGRRLSWQLSGTKVHSGGLLATQQHRRNSSKPLRFDNGNANALRRDFSQTAGVNNKNGKKGSMASGSDRDIENTVEYNADNVSISDSAYGSSIADSTESVGSSIYASIEENGRLYHSFQDGKYVLPNDEQELERLDLQNHLFNLTLDQRLYLAPLDPEKLHNVLDFGTGTGIWAIDFADAYPQARVIGTDLSAVQPKYVPSNLQFEICDAEEEWIFSMKFDYIHGRMMTVCFHDVKEVFRNAYNCTKPGGYFEMQDACSPAISDDGSVDGTAWAGWWDRLIQAGKKSGRPFGTEPPNYKRYMEEVGFVDVQERVFHWPFGPWMKDKKMKEIGLWARANAIDALQGVALASMTRHGGKSKEEVELELVTVRKDLMNPKIHSYMPVYIVWGRKPER